MREKLTGKWLSLMLRIQRLQTLMVSVRRNCNLNVPGIQLPALVACLHFHRYWWCKEAEAGIPGSHGRLVQNVQSTWWKTWEPVCVQWWIQEQGRVNVWWHQQYFVFKNTHKKGNLSQFTLSNKITFLVCHKAFAINTIKDTHEYWNGTDTEQD